MEFDEFEKFIAAAGLKPTAQALREMHAALPLIEAMRARVAADFDMAEEPATAFDADRGR